MKTIALHPASVLAGLALAAVLGAAQSVARVQPLPKETVRPVGEIPAEWSTYVQLRTAPDGTPISTYTVPLNRHFVVTRCNEYYPVFVDGQNMPALVGVNQYNPDWGAGNGTRVPLPP